MIIYAVMKNVQQNDSDCWSHWVEEEQIRLFSNVDSANKFIKAELVKMAEEELADATCNTHIPKEQFKKTAKLILKNKWYFSGSNNGGELFLGALLIIREVEVFE